MSTSRRPSSRRPRLSKGRRPPTIRTVAELARVSRQTVSNVLNAPERVLPETRERVQRAIDELGYRPNRLGSALQSRTTRTFAYRCHISEEGENLLLDRFLHDLCRAAARRQHHILLVSPTDVDDELAAYEEMHRTGSVDGCVLSGTHPGDPRLGFALDHAIPSVSFGRNWDRPDLGGWVDIDGAAGIADAVRHFAGKGHRTIAWIGETHGGVVSDRRDGYRGAVDTLGLPRVEIESAETIEESAVGAMAALTSASPPTAFVCATDVAAVGCARAAAELRMGIGTDIGIMGFDDTRLAMAVSPHLSSIRQPTERVAEMLVDGLIAMVSTGAVMAPSMLAPSLVHRGSS